MLTEASEDGDKSTLRRQSCRSCGGSFGAVFIDLGDQPPSNAYLESMGQVSEERTYPLKAVVCGDCRLVQLEYDVDPKILFQNYAYYSSFSSTWLAHARNYAEMVRSRFKIGAASFVAEIASNDGYLLKNFVEAGIRCLGIEPSDTVAAAARAAGVDTDGRFFDRAVGADIAKERGRADLVIANNVWAHVPDLCSFTEGIAALLSEEGVATIEVQHLLPLMEKVEFDTIYHEHFCYYSLFAAERVLARAGLKVFDVEELSTHGGSLRYFITHESNTTHKPGLGLEKVRADEAAAGIEDMSTYESFGVKAAVAMASLRKFLDAAQTLGKKVYAYGAAAKGNTLLNSCAVSPDLINAVADKNPHKQGKLLPGSHIPIIAPDDLLKARPDYILILPWNLKTEIMESLSAALQWGCQFVTPVPQVLRWSGPELLAR